MRTKLLSALLGTASFLAADNAAIQTPSAPVSSGVKASEPPRFSGRLTARTDFDISPETVQSGALKLERICLA